jgi:hypothetical protein
VICQSRLTSASANSEQMPNTLGRLSGRWLPNSTAVPLRDTTGVPQMTFCGRPPASRDRAELNGVRALAFGSREAQWWRGLTAGGFATGQMALRRLRPLGCGGGGSIGVRGVVARGGRACTLLSR